MLQQPSRAVLGCAAHSRRAIKTPAVVSDSDVGRLLDEEVCANTSPLAPEATICAEAALRLGRSMPKTKWSRRSRAKSEPQGEHLLHAESALYHAGIPHLLLPFQRDKFASNIFVVPSVPDAQQVYCQTGFRQNGESRLKLIDRDTSRLIRLVEHPI